MPLLSEVEYWEKRSKLVVNEQGIIADNVYKRPLQLRRLLDYNWINEKVLEIGVGNGVIAGTLQAAVQGHWSYLGTELAPGFRQVARSIFQLDTVGADVREIPGSGYTRILALDSLEHVRPEHRAEGYARISAAAADGALLFIHLSRSPSYHDKEFDHPFGLPDLVMLESAGFVLNRYERYTCKHPNGNLDYAFVVMQR